MQWRYATSESLKYVIRLRVQLWLIPDLYKNLYLFIKHCVDSEYCYDIFSNIKNAYSFFKGKDFVEMPLTSTSEKWKTSFLVRNIKYKYVISHVHSYLMFAVVSEIHKKRTMSWLTWIFSVLFRHEIHLHTVVNGVDAGYRYIKGEVLGPVSI